MGVKSLLEVVGGVGGVRFGGIFGLDELVAEVEGGEGEDEVEEPVAAFPLEDDAAVIGEEEEDEREDEELGPEGDEEDGPEGGVDFKAVFLFALFTIEGDMCVGTEQVELLMKE